MLLAACLRAPVTSVGPLLERVGEDTGLGATALGLLGSLPVIGFGVGSALVHRPAMRFGLERVLAFALVALAGAVVLRSVPVAGALWVGTAVIGIASAAGNVLAPAVIKRDHPGRIALVTACFTAVMTTTAATASGLAVPVSDAWGGGWRLPLGALAVVVLPVALLWVVRAVRTPRPEEEHAPAGLPAAGRRSVTMWRSPSAWVVSVFMGLQSASFFTLATWLPTVETSLGVDPRAAGWHLFVLQLVGMLAGLLVATLMRGRTDLRPLGVAISLCIVVAMGGLLLAPQVAVAWVALAAVGTGSSLVLALSLFGLRTAHSRHTAQLSSMAQTIGYAIAACGPLLAGWVGGTFSWSFVLVVVGGFGVAQLVVVLGAARPGLVVGR
ncbi:MFS transporter, CP family, cyanate transporter [Georgenia satyanarayanai]|uniref:MFS transporter, CP family, cyanate transporter n=2 Tax=Georgenia satyanarayanai TaxID=860221 RepID=A0A2Y9C4Q4_9MICO|nr:CP family cyanate transporter-like MFS transporter [Georgenia satyanarayanai]SSA39993.1 MFS transporter, CP family, cyanate transporter [Georgenia satyanarayanai]